MVYNSGTPRSILSTVNPSGHALNAPPKPNTKRNLDRDVLVSVLEAAATKRDAKGYLQKYASKTPKILSRTPQFQQGRPSKTVRELPEGSSNIAIVKIRAPAQLDEQTVDGVARTLDQLRLLGLLSVVVMDCGPDATVKECNHQAARLCEAIDEFGKPGSRFMPPIFTRKMVPNTARPAFLTDQVEVDDFRAMDQALQHRRIPVLPPLASPDATHAPKPTDANDLVLALTRYFSGLQFNTGETTRDVDEALLEPVSKIASVERIIILDPLGGIPKSNCPDIRHRFINLEQEYDELTSYFLGENSEEFSNKHNSSAEIHASNLRLAKEALSILPSTSSALITTSNEAANSDRRETHTVLRNLGASIDDTATIRRKQNPVLYNLLTDKPVYSSSLPTQRIQSEAGDRAQEKQVPSNTATLVKRGMPVTIFPDTRAGPWQPPRPGSPRLRLTDRCIDLPRLMYLIEDSFNRKIDVQDYLDRVDDNLAGVIIAGEYEGGAILTWEKPPGLSEEEAYQTGRMVPYLDKFAVLKSRQGSGGVADIVFNAMVRDCFPEGVCWRSRKDNPVNKWYFERSKGTEFLAGSNWKMFWTTPGVLPGTTTHQDYEAVCRGVEPSWADNKHIVD
ncbi:hypothetical protein NLU13_4937 [Sarocladium strictum]|uniref:Amino-acid acetyltransferase, mitochondrial n=1 Tax=Sarocladium strictum TaxID=5046 RepID=A0AA39GKM1_SARSR|nr:hypothetical protein NLU13_4937 [Sarocladium strictum]